MTPSNTSERAFEDAIERWLIERGGYTKSLSDDFDRSLGLDTKQLFAFIQDTQP